MLEKIVSNKIYRIIIFILEGLTIVNTCIMFCMGKFGNNEPVNWTFFWLNILFCVIVFITDCVLNGLAGKFIFVKKKEEAGFQAKRYTYISLIVSIALAVLYWLLRTIIYGGVTDGGTFSLLLILTLMCTTFSCLFFFMIITFLISNKIALAKNNEVK